MKALLFTFIVGLLPVVAAAATLDAGQKLVIIGDSISEGYGVAREEAYPSLMQKKLDQAGKKWTIVNQSISGSTTSSASSRVTWALKSKPSLVLLALGANDGLRGVPAKTIEDNLVKAIQLCQNAHVKVILVGMKLPPNYGSDYRTQFESVFPDLSKRFGVPLIPFLLKNVGGIKALNQEDGIHPNAKGHVIVADTIYSALKEYL
jgi:acyl-CoA thioesterase I